MREILFRGKRKDNGDWIDGNLFIPDEGHDAPTEICIGTNIVRITYDIDTDTVSEFTGLYDKNGKRIFEGDIVEYENEIGLHRDIVVWTLDEYNKVAGFGLEYHVFYTITKKDQDKFEVIGNKWDNPELLGECRT